MLGLFLLIRVIFCVFFLILIFMALILLFGVFFLGFIFFEYLFACYEGFWLLFCVLRFIIVWLVRTASYFYSSICTRFFYCVFWFLVYVVCLLFGVCMFMIWVSVFFCLSGECTLSVFF